MMDSGVNVPMSSPVVHDVLSEVLGVHGPSGWSADDMCASGWSRDGVGELRSGGHGIDPIVLSCEYRRWWQVW